VCGFASQLRDPAFTLVIEAERANTSPAFPATHPEHPPASSSAAPARHIAYRSFAHGPRYPHFGGDLRCRARNTEFKRVRQGHRPKGSKLAGPHDVIPHHRPLFASLVERDMDLFAPRNLVLQVFGPSVSDSIFNVPR
jgi:hypothetical protein